MTSASRQQRSRLILILLILSGIGLLALFSWQAAQAAARQLENANEELKEAQRMTRDIQRLKNAPRIASLEMESPDEISNRVTAAIRTVNSRTAKLQRLDPQQPIRAGRSEYQTRATEIEIDNIRLAELARFAQRLVQSGQGLEVRDIILSEPTSGSKTAETWLARLTVTQIIYSPR